MSRLPFKSKFSVLLAEITEVSVDIDCDIQALTLDSREVSAGCLFVALKGVAQHGLSYAEKASDLGAVAVIWESDDSVSLPSLSIPLIEISDLRNHLGLIADRFYGSPSQSLNMIGITGTDGKTSVSHFLAQSIPHSAVIGTIGLGPLDKLQKATLTTPDVLTVHKNLEEMQAADVKTVAMEVSSHALDQGRVANVAFDVAVLTNLSRDHLDYHKTVEAYADAKAKLFSWPSLKAVVLNLDDTFGRGLAKKLKNIKTRGGVLINYGVGDLNAYPDGSLVAVKSVYDGNGISATVHFGDQTAQLSVSVLGRFNLSNLLAATGAMLAAGDSLQDVIARLNDVHTVAGRMEKVTASNADFLTVVDFAHTPNALSSVLKALREHTKNKLICVFGCGGDRDAGKRPLMAAIAEQGADIVIVTDDNPRTEDPQKIVRDITVGFKNTDNIIVEHDRAAAIKLAISSAKSGDAVLIAGKGHESQQILATGSVPFNDGEQARMFLQELAA